MTVTPYQVQGRLFDSQLDVKSLPKMNLHEL